MCGLLMVTFKIRLPVDGCIACTGSGHDDLDEIFSSSQRQAPGAENSGVGSSSDLLEGFGPSTAIHSPPGGSDPFDIFQSPARQQPAQMAARSDDLLGGFEGTLGKPAKHTGAIRHFMTL